MPETYSFQAEIQSILNLVINSLYTKKEIFLRELISNASDALDKRRLLTLENPQLPKPSEWFIEIWADEKNGILEVRDNGIGMDRDEVIRYLGTIAKSGTQEFLKNWQKANQEGNSQQMAQLIGQFGVGFYSVFMVAQKVEVETQKLNSPQGVKWTSQAQGHFSIEDFQRPEGVGTTVRLFLKPIEPEAWEIGPITKDWVIQEIVKRYSNYISYPIYWVDAQGQKHRINQQKAIWEKRPQEVTDQEYKEFYRHLSHDWEDPLKWWHFQVEGQVTFSSIVYVPKQKPWNYFMKDYEYGIHFYVRRTLIQENSKDLVPSYLRFIKAMIDTDELPLNVSREFFQNDRRFELIKKAWLNKVLTNFQQWLQKDRSEYEKFFENFGATLKEGIVTDQQNQEKLLSLILFKTQLKPDWVSLEEYLQMLPNSKQAIYFITGESEEHLKDSPFLEALTANNIPVLLLTDAVDEWLVHHLKSYKGQSFVNVMSEAFDGIGIIDSPEEHEWKLRLQPVVEALKNELPGISDIRFSKRLKESPACLVLEKNSPTPLMNKILSQIGEKPQAFKARILELNPTHPWVKALVELTPEAQKEWIEFLYYQALVVESGVIKPVRRYQQVLQKHVKGPGLTTSLIVTPHS